MTAGFATLHSLALYAIGDIHGCYNTFQDLLRAIEFVPGNDRLWLVGDLVARGPRSLEVLQWVHDHKDHLSVVLGNHDIHLIGRYLGIFDARKSDNLDQLLRSGESDQLIGWLRRQPLIHTSNEYVLVHAGILPAWKLAGAIQRARTAEKILRGDRANKLLSNLKQHTYDSWNDENVQEVEFLWTVKTLTLLRCCLSPRSPLFNHTGSPEEAPPPARPWFQYESFASTDKTFIFGHWARLGFYRERNFMCLDSGCVHGEFLTAYCLDDSRTFKVSLKD